MHVSHTYMRERHAMHSHSNKSQRDLCIFALIVLLVMCVFTWSNDSMEIK